MSENTRLEKTERWEDLIGRNTRSGTWHRLRHALWAGLVAFAFLLLNFFEPVDQVMWGVQSRFAEAEATQEFAYIGSDQDIADPYSPNRRQELAKLLRNLDQVGAEKIYVDFVFDQAAPQRYDEDLAAAVAQLEDRIVFIAETTNTIDGFGKITHSLPSIRGDATEVINPDKSDLLGFTWFMPSSEQFEGKSYQTLASALLENASEVPQTILVDYAIPVSELATLDYTQAMNGSDAQSVLGELQGRQVIVGPSRSNGDQTVRIPGSRDVPRGLVAIYAAESHIAGRTQYISAFYWILTTLFALAASIVIISKSKRRFAYALLLAGFPALFAYCVFTGLRVELTNALVLLATFAALRLRFHWQRRASMQDDQTGLGTLRALEDKLQRNTADGYVVVAKVHGYERVLKLLPVGLHATYVRKIAERLKATQPDLEINSGSHYFGWITTETSSTALEDHLNGLRALFGAPLDIGGTPIDVGITFGAARIQKGGERALPAAMAAVEETSEAHEPVRFAIESNQDEALWDISLRSRIDAAMNNGEVYCLYQPKYSLGTNKVSGVEALVRWDDHERGPIPPMVFVQESEKAGRIEQLTRYVLQSACTAGRLLHSRGHKISVSVNVSAIQCSDANIVSTVEQALKASNFPANYLVLEVTETARIRDLASAARVLGQIKQLGVKLSIDDFGVGMANYQTFYELPFDELKIDRLFIKDIQRDAKARAIASSLIQMGSEARITVTAEGVEDPEDLNILEEIGCTQVQGYAISRPITLPNLLDFLEKRKKNIV